MIRLEFLNDSNRADVLGIDRSDISEDWVDSIAHIMALHRYGLEHRCIGHTYAIYADDVCIGIILIGEGIPWDCDPPEVAGIPFYRIMGFVMDRRYRGQGLGGFILEKAIEACYREDGVRPIALGCHKDNIQAAHLVSVYHDVLLYTNSYITSYHEKCRP